MTNNRPYTKIENELALLLALEIVTNPPKTKEALHAYINTLPLSNRIKMRACLLVHEIAREAQTESLEGMDTMTAESAPLT